MKPWLVESLVIVSFCVTSLMCNAVIINYQLIISVLRIFCSVKKKTAKKKFFLHDF